MKKLLIGLLTVLAFTLAIGLVTACSKAEELLTLASPEIRGYEPETGTLSWSPVSGAESYEVSFDDGVNQTTNTVKSNQTKFTTDAEQFAFSITAKGSLHKDSPTVSATFIRLESDIVLSVDENGLITWDPVDDATGYSVSVDGKAGEVITDTEYTVKEGAKHTVKVKPVRDNTQTTYYYSLWSESVSVRLLGSVQPKNIKFEDGKITWTKVSNATGYKVTINGEDYETSVNEYLYDGGDSFDITVQALGDGNTYYNGAVSAAKSFIYLPVVENISVDETGALVWDEVENATGYSVKLNNNSQPQKVTTNKYTKLSAGTQYNISILPTGSNADAEYFSSWSEPEPVFILPAPTLVWSGADVSGADEVNAVQWTIIGGASGYSCRLTKPSVNGQPAEVEETTQGEDRNFFASAFDQIGTYKLEVQALGEDGNGIYDSKYSDAYTIIRLAAPTRPSVTSKAESLADGFTVSFSPVTGAREYQLYSGGTNTGYSSTSPQFKVRGDDIVEDTNVRQQIIAYSIRSMGYSDPGHKTVALSSMLDDVAESGSGFRIKVLATPQDPSIDEFEYSFTGVDGTSNYNLQIGAQNTTLTSQRADLSGISSGTVDVRVCAMGNGREELASTYSTPIEVQRLEAPSNLRISVDESDGVLSFTGDDRAVSYQATFTGEREPLKVDTTTNVKPYIHETATIVVMYSVANFFYDAQQTVYYMTSPASQNYTFLKLAAPTGITFDNDNMKWNSPTNLGNGAAFTPNYKIYNGSTGTVYNGNFPGTSYSLATLKGGESYSFGIVALGDGVRYINSDEAKSRQITKLEKPTLTINTTDFRYEWQSVASASNYALTIDSVSVANYIHEPSGLYTYTPHYDSIGDKHLVTLQALGDNGATTVSSDVVQYNQKVDQLATPKFEYKYSSDCYDVSGKITVNITQETNCPNGYYYTLGSSSTYSKETSFEFTPNTSGAITISVYAFGGSFDKNETYYIDSTATSTVTLNLLGEPNNIDVNEDGIITWGQVNGASGYICKLSIIGTDGQQYYYEYTIGRNEAKLDLSKSITVKVGNTEQTKVISYKDIRTMTLKLQARGILSANQATTTDGSVSSAEVSKSWNSDLH